MQPETPAEAIEAVRAAIRTRWPVQIAPNTAAALARVAVDAAAPILLAAGHTAAAAEIADEIRAELVCCDIYDQLSAARDGRRWKTEMTKGHHLCYWGEASARIAEGKTDG